MKSRITLIEFPVFCGYIVHVEVTSDFKKSFSKYKSTREVNLDANDTRAMAVHVNDISMSYVFLPPNASVGEIAHESWHVIRRMMEYMGVDDSNEAVAYHLGYLTQKIFNFVRRKRV